MKTEGTNIDMMQEYKSRFSQKNWAGVVRLVVEAAGPCLTGALQEFNDLDYVVSYRQYRLLLVQFK